MTKRKLQFEGIPLTVRGMSSSDLFLNNILSPLVLAFALGMLVRLFKSELQFPAAVLRAISGYLLFSIGLKGGIELSKVDFADIFNALIVALVLVLLKPINSYFLLRKVGRLDITNSAAIAAHYGSVSAVTFFASLAFAHRMDLTVEAFMPALVAIMEWGTVVALFIAKMNLSSKECKQSTGDMVMETLRSTGFTLIFGGVAMGWIIGEDGFQPISPLFKDLFQGILVIFLMEMGMTAAAQLKDAAKVGLFLVIFGTLVPILHGAIGVYLSSVMGLSIGGCFVMGTLAASASYIYAPAAVRQALPKANPSMYLTASLGITFPFNLLIGLPIYYEMARYFTAV